MHYCSPIGWFVKNSTMSVEFGYVPLFVAYDRDFECSFIFTRFMNKLFCTSVWM